MKVKDYEVKGSSAKEVLEGIMENIQMLKYLVYPKACTMSI